MNRCLIRFRSSLEMSSPARLKRVISKYPEKYRSMMQCTVRELKSRNVVDPVKDEMTLEPVTR